MRMGALDKTFEPVAEKAFSDEQSKQRLQRAQAMGHRKTSHYLPGDLVFFWRKQQAGKTHQSFPKGRFLGPARVLATETRQEADGTLRPASVVWIHRGGHLLRAAQEQLRHASPREVLIEELKGPVQIPWTMTTLASYPSRRTYQDITSEVPDDMEWEAVQEHQGKSDHEKRLEQQQERDVATRKVRITPASDEQGPDQKGARRPGVAQEPNVPQTTSPRTSIPSVGRHEAHPPGPESDFEMSMVAVEIHIPLPDSKRALKKFTQNPSAYFSEKLKRKQVEVSERHLTKAEREEFIKAKDTEVRNFLGSQCFKAWKGEDVREEEVLGMRWLLTWKYDEKYSDIGGKKAKARAVVLGYQDPSYHVRETSAPTPSRAGRQLFLQMCSWKRFEIQKGAVSGAFLQGDNLTEPLWCRPLPEMCKHLGVEEGTPMMMQNAAYGLVQAPLHWYRSVSNYLSSLGYRRLKMEPCCWIYVGEDGNTKSVIHGHVDDFMFGGHPECPVHRGLMEKIKKRFVWGTWEKKEFLQCGIHIKQNEDFSIEMDQKKSIDELEEIRIGRDRSRQGAAPTTDSEKRDLRAVLGSLSWICGQTQFMYSVDVNFLITTIPVSTVSDLLKANQVVRAVK